MVPIQKPGKSKQNYCTPKVFVNAVLDRLDIEYFDIDLAASKENSIGLSFYDEAYDSLKRQGDWVQPYSYRWHWCNPPYSDIGAWVKKAYAESLSGARIAMLLPASVGSNWYRDWVDHKCYTLLLNGRLAFMPDKPTWLYPKDCMLLLYGLAGGVTGSQVWNWHDSK